MKITEATNEQKIKELAKLDGLTLNILNGVTFCWSEERNKTLPADDDGMMVMPKYLTSYNAIIPLVQKQDSNVIKEIVLHHVDGSEQADYAGMYIIMLSPQQLCDALLVAIGKFEL